MTVNYTKKRRKALWGITRHEVRRFALIAFPLLLIGYWLDETPFGEEVQVATYNLMQRRLAASPIPAKLSVVVVDISSVKPVDVDDGISKKKVTPRADVLRLLEAIVPHRPAAIGVDVDFSPEAGSQTFVTAGDPAFFDRVKALSQKLKSETGDAGRGIYLGVARNVGDRNVWLGSAEYAELAGGIVLPFAENGPVVRSMPTYLRPVTACGENPSERCGDLPSLATAMVGARRKVLHGWRSVIMESDSGFERSSNDDAGEEKGATIVGRDYLVDFGALDPMIAETFPASGVTAVADQDRIFEDRYVLLGDTDLSAVGDRFGIPGHPEQIKGVYAHASAIYTLVQRPLYALKPHVDLVIDVLLGASSLVVVALLRFAFASRVREELAKERVDLAMTLLVVLLLVYIGHLAVYRLRLVWIGYALVILMQLLHLIVDRTLHGDVRGHEAARPAWRRWLFESPGEP